MSAPRSNSRHDGPVEPLGHVGTKYFYYFNRPTQQVRRLTAAQHTSHEFLSMADRADWLRYPGATAIDGEGFTYEGLGALLMHDCRAAGIYDPNIVRGCGVWRDGDDIVFHAGDRLYVNGEEMQFEDYTSTDFRYLAGLRSGQLASEPATAADVQEFLQILETFGFQHQDLGPKLVLGWIGCALVCGALEWRPQMWITGRRGTGKSTLDGIIASVLAPQVLPFQSITTEAGLRQSLNGDARPIIIDEFEADGPNARGIIVAARSAASDNAAPVVKGTSGGQPQTYRLRFAGMLSGVIANLVNAADQSRFVILELEPRKYDEADRKRLAEAQERCDATFGSHLLRRVINALMDGRFNRSLVALRIAIRDMGGDERKGDVFGHLLAGYQVLMSDDEISREDAIALVLELQKLDDVEETDEEACVNHLLGYRPKFDELPFTIGESLINLSKETAYIDRKDVLEGLARMGVILDGETVLIANATTGIKEVFRGSRWADGAHKRILRRLNGAQVAGHGRRFAGAQSRAVTVPLRSLIPDE